MPEPEPKSYAKRLVKGSIIIFTASVLSAFIAILLRAFLARSLNAADYGLFYFIFSLISLPTLFYDWGFCKALARYTPEFFVKKEFGAIKSSMALVTLLQAISALSIVAVLLVFSNQIALTIFKTGAAVLPLRILCVWILVNVVYRILGATFQGLQNMPALALIGFLLDMSNFLMVVLFVGVIGWGVGGVAVAYFAAMSAVTVFGLAYLMRRYSQVFKEKMLINKPLFKKLFVFALPVFIGSLAFIVLQYADTLLIGVLRTNAEVGFYQVAQPIASLLLYLVGALSTVFFPMVSEMWTKGESRILRSAMHFLTKFSFVLLIPATLVIVAFPDIIIRLIFGEGYLAGATALQILGSASIVYTLFTILFITINGICKPIIGMGVVGAMACLSLVGNLLLIPSYGIEGAATAFFASYALGSLLLFYFVRKFLRFTMPILPLFKTVVGGVLTLLLIFGLKFLLPLSPWPEAFAVMIPSLLFYGVWILATGAITKDDLRLIARIVPMPKWLVKLISKLVK